MRQIVVSSLVLIALAAFTATPGLAAEVDEVVEQAVETQAELPLEEPLMTPAEEPEIPDLGALDPESWEEKIRQCDEWEAVQYCGVGCDCVITYSNVYCFC